MQKLLRLAILSLVFLVSFVFFFCLFPSLVFILSGEFLAVLHHPAYVVFGGGGWAITLGITFHGQFDKNLYVKN